MRPGTPQIRLDLDFSKHIQKAEEALRRRNHDFAVELYRQLVDLDPDHEAARAGLRRALKVRHDSRGGKKLFRAVAGALPLGRAKTLRKLGKHEACARALEDYLGTNPVDEEANLMLGMSLEDAGHYRAAKAVYEFLADLAPRSPEALKRAGAMMYRAGDHPGALAYYERALEADPRDQEALKARKNLAAETALARQESEDVTHSRDLVRDEERTRRLERKNRQHLSPEELREELTALENRLAENANDPDLLLEAARVHEGLGDGEAALDLAERAFSYRRDSVDLAKYVGRLKSKLLKKRIARADKAGDAAEANRLEAELLAFEVEDAQRRVELRPGDSAQRLALAKKLIRVERIDEAVAELQRCQNDQRARSDALFLLGQCFQRKGILDLARKQFERALETTPESDERAKEILYNLGTIAESTGDPQEARSFYLRIYEIDIGYRDVAAKMVELN